MLACNRSLLAKQADKHLAERTEMMITDFAAIHAGVSRGWLCKGRGDHQTVLRRRGVRDVRVDTCGTQGLKPAQDVVQLTASLAGRVRTAMDSNDWDRSEIPRQASGHFGKVPP